MASVRGIVQKIHKNDAGFFNIKLGDEWFGAGKYKPKCDEGAEISFDVTENGKYKNMTNNTLKVLEDAPPQQQQEAQSGASTASKGVDWDLKDKRITYLACRKDALSLLALAIQTDSITLPTKKADKLDALTEMVVAMTNGMFAEVYDAPFKE